MKILVATDGSQASDKAVDVALARARLTGDQVIIANVSEIFCPVGVTELDPTVFEEASRKESAAIIAAAMARAKSAGIEAQAVQEPGSPADTLVSIAKREGVEEIFIASHGRHGLARFAMGSVSTRVVEWAPCTVTVVK
ncbi:MAG: universal stress protein [Rhodocyclaceae bacterium]|nr:universal stress protein [Rhodocyclaceae bacterium]MDP1957823.1 universal stress protein [Rhodocyclaceae bacterium]